MMATRVYARIERTKHGWSASYHTETDGWLIGTTFSQLYSFAFTQAGIEKKARRKINKLEKEANRKRESYKYGKENFENF